MLKLYRLSRLHGGSARRLYAADVQSLRTAMSENDVASTNVPATKDEISNMVDLWGYRYGYDFLMLGCHWPLRAGCA